MLQFEASASKQLELSDWLLSSGTRADRERNAASSRGNSPLARPTNSTTSAGPSGSWTAVEGSNGSAATTQPTALRAQVEWVELADRATCGATRRIALRRPDSATDDLSNWCEALAKAGAARASAGPQLKLKQ